jgi:integrase
MPVWGKRTYTGISRPDIIALVEGLITDGKPVLANRVHSLVSKILNFAVDAGLIPFNPAARLKKRGPETAHSRVLSDDEVRWFWTKVTASPRSISIGLAAKLGLLTGLRAGEAAGLRRSEVVDIEDPAKAALLIDGSRIKNGQTHFVPLSPMARSLVLEALDLAGAGEFVFPSRTDSTASLDPHAFVWMMSRGADKAAALESWRANPPTAHDLRRTLATRLAALGVAREDRLAILNHKPGDVHGRHYDHFDRAPQKRIALNLWATTLADILAGKEANSNVLPMRRPS